MIRMEQRFIQTIHQVYREKGRDAFFGWFNGDPNNEVALKDGFYDFAVTVLRDPVPRFLSNPYEKVALEIGYGGGRLLNAAAHMFREVIGVDIHDLGLVVEEMLRASGLSNFRLCKGSGKEIPIDACSVDFVYSHIVFLHLSGPDVLEAYVNETFRVLKPGGIASFYYGRPFSYRSHTAQSRLVSRLYHAIEPIAETVLLDILGDGYRRKPEGRANTVSLMVTRRKMKGVAKACGFQVVGRQSRRGWMQGHIVLRKPKN